MAAPKSTLWPIEPHTEAKHRVLKHYLDAWIPIMATQSRRLALIDGFAGPGEYRGGQPGSPVIMVKAFAHHSRRSQIQSQTRIEYLFVEADEKRYNHLRRKVSLVEAGLPDHWTRPTVVHGDFGQVVGPKVEELGAQDVPIFLFIDPFGYSDPPPELSARLLKFGRCETLTFVPTNAIARFLNDANMERTFDHFFGRPTWRSARSLTGSGVIEHLVSLFEERQREDARHTRTFVVETTDGNLYHLFFATNNHRGLEKMKEAMWTVDPQGGTTFSDRTTPGQDVMFSDTADMHLLETQIRGRFPTGAWHAYPDLELFTWDETAYLPRHLKADLERMIDARKAQAIERGPKGGFIDRSKIEFLD